nr:mechanosensitive ion channel family protein [Verrucomicrobiota bacterium JB025]
MNGWHKTVEGWLGRGKVSGSDWIPVLADSLMLLLVLLAAFAVYFIALRIVVRLIRAAVKRTENTWDDELVHSRVFRWIAQLVPGMVLWVGGQAVLRDPTASDIVRILAEVYIIVCSILTLNSVLNVCERIYRRFPVSREVPIKGFIQVFKILLFVAGTIFVVASVIGKSPVLIFSGLGALTAVMMLIFKDSILGLVAGVQLSANRMIARGDWIEMPKFGADGDVIDVALTTVKVQNFDKTITTIPTYALISDSFRNWRGMSESGVRRIKRNLLLDMNSVRLLDPPSVERFRKIRLLRDYLDTKKKELDEWNRQFPDEEIGEPVNARALTNLGTFRAYIGEYLKVHPRISKNHTLLVRQLQPTEHGLPIEIYVFTNDNRWIEYEGIQSDIFDHLLAVLPEFGLNVFQAPSGADLKALK